MAIRICRKMVDSSNSPSLSINYISITEAIDVRDLLIRMHSDDVRTRERARKTLLNYIHQVNDKPEKQNT